MAKKQFRGVIAFDFDVDQENYKMFGELEKQLEAHMDLFAKRLAAGDMDSEFPLSKHVTVENPQSHFRDRRGPTGPVDQMVFRGGRGENTKISGAQMDRLQEMGFRLLEGMGLGHALFLLWNPLELFGVLHTPDGIPCFSLCVGARDAAAVEAQFSVSRQRRVGC